MSIKEIPIGITDEEKIRYINAYRPRYSSPGVELKDDDDIEVIKRQHPLNIFYVFKDLWVSFGGVFLGLGTLMTKAIDAIQMFISMIVALIGFSFVMFVIGLIIEAIKN